MPLAQNTYGKSRVRVLRVYRDGPNDEVRELSVQAMLEGDFAASYTDGDNTKVIATDTIKNIVNIVAAEHLRAPAEIYAQHLAARLLDRYPQITRARITCHAPAWTRAPVDGTAHPHHFVLDANGQPIAHIDATRDAVTITSGIENFTFMKSTQSGWVGFVQDDYTTLPETTDRILATAMTATWLWTRPPADYEATNAKILRTMLADFATTYSRGVQDSLFRMAEHALAAIPELESISMACPNKHYIPINLERFGIPPNHGVFTPTDDPHGQIECTVTRTEPAPS